MERERFRMFESILCQVADYDPEIVESLIGLAVEIAREGREGPRRADRGHPPALGSFDRAYGWLTPLSDQWDAALANYAANASDIRAEQSTLVTRARNAKTIELDSGHYVFIDRRDAVLAAMRKFLLPGLSRVPPPARPSS